MLRVLYCAHAYVYDYDNATHLSKALDVEAAFITLGKSKSEYGL